MTQTPDDPTKPNDTGDPADSEKAARKERVLHTRVPAVLEQELKRLAHSWRVPVSNVVRAILEDAVAAVDVVGRRAEGNLHHVVDRLAEQRERLRTMTTQESREEQAPPESSVTAAQPEPASAAPVADDVMAGIMGFQPLKLAAKTTCSRCGRAMRVGEEAYLGVREGPGPRVLIGAECLPNPQDDEDEKPTEVQS